VSWRFPSAVAQLAALAAIGLLVAVVVAAVTGTPARATSYAQAPSYAQPLPEASGGLDVVPFPGTPDVPPGTRIDFPALAPAQLVSIRAVGSHSGSHTGTLSAQPGGRGTQFTPDRPFAAGERVWVSAGLASKPAAAAAGAPGARSLRFSFQIATPAPEHVSGSASLGSAGSPSLKHSGFARSGPGSPKAKTQLTQTFHSAPRLHPPLVRMIGQDTDTAAGDIFLDAHHSAHRGPYILNSAGGLLWFGQLRGRRGLASDVRVQHYAHHPVLTYHQGTPTRGVGVLLNDHYQRVHTVTAGDGYQRQGFTMHEFQLTPQGTALAEVVATVHANLTSVGGPPNGLVYDTIIQEVDVASNRVVWEWSALGHLPLRDSYAKYQPGVPFEAFHLNSIQQLPGGNLLISLRHMWAVFSINKKSGKVNWELGGKHSSFSIGRGAHFEWQHDARLHGNRLLTVFDNGAGLTRNASQSRALKIFLDGRHATLLHAYEHIPAVLALSQGSVQLLPNGNVFVGWGFAPTFSEYTRAGRQIFTGWFHSPVQSYRAYRAHWTGKPPWPPSIDVTRPGPGKITVYASWNGATEVARWRVLAGASKTALKPVARAPRRGFETRVAVHTGQQYVEAQALAASGKVLATSKVDSRKGGCVGPEC
jgi:hypothetical protein